MGSGTNTKKELVGLPFFSLPLDANGRRREFMMAVAVRGVFVCGEDRCKQELAVMSGVLGVCWYSFLWL